MTDDVEEVKELEEEFPSNAKSRRTETRHRSSLSGDRGHEIVEKKKSKIKAKGRGLRKKPTLAGSLSKTFFGEDTRSVGQYILYDVLIPAAKNLIQEMVSSGIEMLLFGETRGRNRSHSDRDKGRSIVSYGSFYKNREEPRRHSTSRGRFNLDDIVFRHGDEASDVLDGLIDLLEEYQEVTVADFYELAGVEGATWADQKWGWKNLNKAYCTHTRGGYAIVLPNPIELD